jgi:hypothetical protein
MVVDVQERGTFRLLLISMPLLDSYIAKSDRMFIHAGVGGTN